MARNEHAAAGLRRAVDRLTYNENFVASAYQDLSGSCIDLDRIAERLATDLDTAVHVGLCRRPWAKSPAFAADTAKIASRAGIHPDTLMALLREAESLRAFRVAQPSERGLLAAARDHRNGGPEGSDLQ